jgi:ATP-binding cassette subfamily B protein
MIYVVITCLNVVGLYFLWKNGRIQPGDFLLVLGINHNTNAFLSYAVFQLGSIMEKYGKAAQAIDEILNVDAPENHEKCKPISVSEGAIEVRDLVFGYNSDNTILNGVSFKINPGEKICIVGPSGSGKSTIVKLLLRLYRPTSGSIMIDNQDIQDANIEDLNQNIGAMPQDIFVFNRSIRDNICYNNEPIEEVISIAKRIGIHDAIMKLKDGYDTIIGEGAEDDLSGGQKQRISAVRALIRAKRILILDEPTSHLDVRTTKLVHREIKKICSENKTTLITVAHNLEAVSDVSIDKVMVVVDGKVVEFGPHMDLLKNKNGIYYNMWNTHLTQIAEEKSMEHPAEESVQGSL